VRSAAVGARSAEKGGKNPVEKIKLARGGVAGRGGGPRVTGQRAMRCEVSSSGERVERDEEVRRFKAFRVDQRRGNTFWGRRGQSRMVYTFLIS